MAFFLVIVGIFFLSFVCTASAKMAPGPSKDPISGKAYAGVGLSFYRE